MWLFCVFLKPSEKAHLDVVWSPFNVPKWQKHLCFTFQKCFVIVSHQHPSLQFPITSYPLFDNIDYGTWFWSMLTWWHHTVLLVYQLCIHYVGLSWGFDILPPWSRVMFVLNRLCSLIGSLWSSASSPAATPTQVKSIVTTILKGG